MASTCKCEYCGATIATNNRECPNCGASNPLYVVDEERIITDPRTIEELQEYCAERGMPLSRMRFFIGVDFKDPKAFGIYRETDGDVVVYKNKADGSRAIRYKGKDERHAVNEIYGKLLEECHNRGIYPDGKSSSPYMSRSMGQGSDYSGSNNSYGSGITRSSYSNGTKKGCRGMSFGLGVWVVIVISGMLIFNFVSSKLKNHPSGYYQYNDDMYYYQGNDWYYFDDADDDWYPVDNSITDSIYDANTDYYYNDTWNSDWGTSFYNSDAYREYQESHPSSSDDDDDWDSGYSWDDSDWDDWDSGSSDWDSDW